MTLFRIIAVKVLPLGLWCLKEDRGMQTRSFASDCLIVLPLSFKREATFDAITILDWNRQEVSMLGQLEWNIENII